MKVGRDVESDIQRLESLHRTFPDLQFVVDPNQGYSREQAMTFGKGARRIGATILVYEQPLHRDDWEGQAKLRQELGIPLAADESVRGIEDLSTIIKYQAADFINIKIMKSGVIQALDIALVARALGFRLMIGGMVETRLAMGCSFSLVLGLGGFETLDLDTPLLLAEDPLGGGYQYQGPYLQPWEVPGIGIIMDWESPSLILE